MKIGDLKTYLMRKTILTIGATLIAASWTFAMPSGLAMQSDADAECYKKFNVPAAAKTKSPLKATRADGTTIEFGYADEVISALGNGQVQEGMYCYQAFEFLPSDLKIYKGASITAVNVTMGINSLYRRNPITSGTIFLTYDLKSEPFYKQDVRFKTEAFASNACKLDHPIELTDDKPIYVGYYFKAPKLTEFYMTVDDLPVEANTALTALGDGEKIPQTWTNLAPLYGSFCISVTLEGNKLPQNLLTANTVRAPFCTELGKRQRIGVRLRNRGASPVNEFKVKLNVTGEDEEIIPIKLRKGLPNNASVDTVLTTQPTKTEGAKQILVSVPEINGVENLYKDAYAQGQTVVSSNFYDRALVMEEVTGTWCQWCPAGFVMMDYLKQNFNNKVYRIAIHNDDVMAVESYQTMLPMFFSGLPGAVLNRKIDCPPLAEGVLPLLNGVAKQLINGKTYAKVWSEGCTVSEDKKTATLHTYASFVADINDTFSLSAAVIEDGMGPYDQANAYSGGGNGAMGGWENKANPVSTIYDDVARYLSSYPGENVYPATVKQGETYHNTVNLDLSAVKSDKFHVITMLTDKTGEIIAAGQEEFTKSGIEDISNHEFIDVKVGEGSIEVTNASNVAIYNMAGIKVADGGATGLPAGIYVVKADGKMMKVFVR